MPYLVVVKPGSQHNTTSKRDQQVERSKKKNRERDKDEKREKKEKKQRKGIVSKVGRRRIGSMSFMHGKYVISM